MVSDVNLHPYTPVEVAKSVQRYLIFAILVGWCELEPCSTLA